MYRRVPFQGLNSLPTPSMMEGVCEEQIQGQGPMQDRCIQSSLPSLLPNPHEQRLDEISGEDHGGRYLPQEARPEREIGGEMRVLNSKRNSFPFSTCLPFRRLIATWN